MTYTYEPSEINLMSVSRVRFTLGDTNVEGGASTCMLSDDEIKAVLNSGYGWKMVLYKLADAVCMKLSFETDWKNDGTSFNLNQRATRWFTLRDQLKKEVTFALPVPPEGLPDSVVSLMSDGRVDAAWSLMYPAYLAGDEL